MSMICNLRLARREDLEQLLAAPEYVTSFLHAEEADPPEAAADGFLSRLFGGRRRRPSPPPTWSPRQDGDDVDLDKTWHGLHFLFTGTAWEGSEPGCYLVRGGQEIGDEDVGYGPARALMPDEVQRFAEFLEQLTPDELARRYDPERMKALEIYPDIWTNTEEDGESEVDYLLGGFDTLRDAVRRARTAEAGLVIYLN
jgi:hypothetical protein